MDLTSEEKLILNRLRRAQQRHESSVQRVGELIETILDKYNLHEIELPTGDEDGRIDLYSEVKSSLPLNWIYDDPTDILIYTLVCFFAEVEKFLLSPMLVSKDSASIGKGILLYGNTGTGKTKIIQAFCNALKNTPHEFSYYEVGDICERWEGDEKFRIELSRGRKTVVIDDLGCEETEKLYAYGKNPIPALISQRYKSFDRSGIKTIFITNYSGEEMAQIYEPRILDRIVGMSNILKMEGQSKR